jgi:CubicO group peptidase (beta-lactamase class C family)
MRRMPILLLLASLAVSAIGWSPNFTSGWPPGPTTRIHGSGSDPGEKVNLLFAQWERNDSPGCAVAVLRKGRIVYQRGYGMADLEHGVRITPSTVFHVGSMAKQFTAVCVLLLAEEGKLALDDDIRKYVAELPDFGEPITLRQMLHHTSGLREHHNLLQFAGWRWRDLITERDILAVLCRQRGLNFRPGEEFLYSNSNYALLAVVIKRVSGKSLREFAQERIFKPLSMSRTQFVEDHAVAVEGRAAGHVRRDAGGYDVERPAYDFNGSTNLLTTVEDLAKWDANFYEPTVGNKEIVTKMTTAGRLKGGDEIGYGSGLFLGNYRKVPIVSHAGSDVGFRAEMLRFPGQHFSVIVLCNLFDMSATRLAQQVADLYLADVFPKEGPRKSPSGPPGASPSAADLQGLAGLYWSERLAQTRRFAVKDGQLQMVTSEGPYALVAVGPQEFQLPVAPRRYTFTFILGGPNRPLRVREDIEGQRPEEFEAASEAKPTFAELAVYTGSFFSDELNVVWSVEARDGQLFLHRRKFRDDPLKPVLANVFDSGAGTLRFQRSGDGRITGFTVTTERIRHLRFLKSE